MGYPGSVTDSAEHLATAVRQIIDEAVEAALRARPQAAPSPPELPDTINQPADRLLYSVKEIPTKLGISRTTVYQLLGEGRLPSVRIGSRRSVTAQALSTYVQGLR